jgi:hypothetical protein
MNTQIKILENYDIYPDNTKFGVPESTETMEAAFNLKLPNGERAVLIDKINCEYIIETLEGGLHYPKLKENNKEGYYVKDGYFDHCGDMIRYDMADCFNENELSQIFKENTPPKTSYVRNESGRVVGLIDSSSSRMSVNAGRDNYPAGRDRYRKTSKKGGRRRFETSRYNYAS